MTIDLRTRVTNLPALPPTPLVSIILAVRNEERQITRALDGARLQDWPRECLEILVVDGVSNDRTRELVARVAARDPRVRLLDNPAGYVAQGLNVGLAAARGAVILRVDGHCRIVSDHVRRCVAELRAGQAECVGGPVRAVGDTLLAKAIALAMSTPFGVGGASFRWARERREVDHLPFGAWRREVFGWIGGFDESLVRNQDDEFSDRLRRAGGRIMMLPELLADYYSRATLGGLWNQYHGYGYWKVRVIRKRGGWPSSPRHLVPAAFVLGMLASGALVASGAWALGAIAPTLYALFLLGATAETAVSQRTRASALLSLALPVMHTAYGVGFLRALFARGPRPTLATQSLAVSDSPVAEVKVA